MAIKIYRWLSILFALCIALQVFLAGLAVFSDASHWKDHVSFVRYFSLIPVVMLVLAIIGRAPALRMHSLALIFMIVLMFVTAIFASDIGLFSALHPVIALMLFWRTFDTIRLSKKWTAEPEQA